MPKTPIRQGQVWHAKGYAEWTDRVVIIRRAGEKHIIIELRDGRKIITTATQLQENYRLLPSKDTDK